METIIQLITIVVSLILGVVSKRSKIISNNLIPLQNIIIGAVMMVIEWIITKDLSLAVGLSGLCAGGTYDFIKNLRELKKLQEVVGDTPEVFEEVEYVESDD